MDFDLSWLGAPTADALSGAVGHVQLSLDKGQIAGIKPGAGRVLGLASIAALPRRLALDFSDLTDKGSHSIPFAATSICATATPTRRTSWSRGRPRKSDLLGGLAEKQGL